MKCITRVSVVTKEGSRSFEVGTEAPNSKDIIETIVAEGENIYCLDNAGETLVQISKKVPYILEYELH
jgi:hypothetical protein